VTNVTFIEEGVPVHDADAVMHRLYEGEARRIAMYDNTP
jgi:hypothetical protein